MLIYFKYSAAITSVFSVEWSFRILICCLEAQETFLIITNVENSLFNIFAETMILFFGFFDEQQQDLFETKIFYDIINVFNYHFK